MNRFNQQILMNNGRNPLLFGLVGIFLLFFSTKSFAEDTSANGQVNAQIQRYMESLLEDRFVKFELDIQPVDARLNLSYCSSDLQIQHRPSNRISGRLTMKISCDGESPWRIHVPVKVQAFDNIVVSRLPLAMGTQITEQDVTVELKDVSRLRNGYFSSASQVAGYVTKRPLGADQVLNANLLKPPQMIDRGEKVVILAEGSGLSIRTTGIAMEDGAHGELIRVKNAKTNKVVEGRISGPGQIKVSL